MAKKEYHYRKGMECKCPFCGKINLIYDYGFDWYKTDDCEHLINFYESDYKYNTRFCFVFEGVKNKET